MASKYLFLVFILLFSVKVESSSLIERSYEYVLNLGKSLAPNFMTFMDCLGEDEFWSCAKEKAGKMIENVDAENNIQRRMWQEAADAEVASSGRSLEEPPSKLGREVEDSLQSVADMVQYGVARALSRKHHEDGGIDSITISTGGGDKKKKMKKKPAKIHLVHPVMMMNKKEEDSQLKVQSWVIGDKIDSGVETQPMDRVHSRQNVEDNVKISEGDVAKQNVRVARNMVNEKDIDTVHGEEVVKGNRVARNMLTDLWGVGEKAVNELVEHAVESDNVDNGIEDKSSVQEHRGKKKKKKKAILKLMILGAVLKAKIGTLLQILSFKLQVKFFLIALVGLAINLARFWIDLKKQHHQQPQKVIYYEHAQHQHHYDHEEEPPAWGPWSRSMDPEEETVADTDINSSPYRAQIERNTQIFNRPPLSRA